MSENNLSSSSDVIYLEDHPLLFVDKISYSELRSIVHGVLNDKKIEVQGHELDGTRQYTGPEELSQLAEFFNELILKTTDLTDMQREALRIETLLQDHAPDLEKMDRIARGDVREEDLRRLLYGDGAEAISECLSEGAALVMSDPTYCDSNRLFDENQNLKVPKP